MTGRTISSVVNRSIKRFVHGACNDVILACLQIGDALAVMPLDEMDPIHQQKLHNVAVSLGDASAKLQELKVLIDRT